MRSFLSGVLTAAPGQSGRDWNPWSDVCVRGKSARGLAQSKTASVVGCLVGAPAFWTAPVLWRFRLACMCQTVSIARSQSNLRLWLVCTCLAALASLSPAVLFAASFTATLDRESVTVGETATLTLAFEGGQPKAIPAPPAIPNLQIADRGSSQNITIVNGQVTATVSQTFELTPTQPGEFNIPALRAEVDGQILTSQPLKLTAVKAMASAGNPNGD